MDGTVTKNGWCKSRHHLPFEPNPLISTDTIWSLIAAFYHCTKDPNEKGVMLHLPREVCFRLVWFVTNTVNCVPHNSVCHIVYLTCPHFGLIGPIRPFSGRVLSLGTSLLATCGATPTKGPLRFDLFLHFEWQGFALGFCCYPSTIVLYS